jgi:hypothetical protein
LTVKICCLTLPDPYRPCLLTNGLRSEQLDFYPPGRPLADIRESRIRPSEP